MTSARAGQRSKRVLALFEAIRWLTFDERRAGMIGPAQAMQATGLSSAYCWRIRRGEQDHARCTGRPLNACGHAM